MNGTRVSAAERVFASCQHATMAMVAAARGGVRCSTILEGYVLSGRSKIIGPVIDSASCARELGAASEYLFAALNSSVFFGPPPVGLARQPREAPGWMRLPIEVLVLACVVVGIFPATTMGPFLDTAAQAVLGENTPAYSLAVWHGFTAPLILSVVAIGLGTIGYVLARKRLNLTTGPPLLSRLKGKRTFEWLLAAVISVARWLERLLGTRRLQTQLRLVAVIACLAGLLPFLRQGYSLGGEPGTPLDPGFAVIWIVGGACAIGAAWQAKYHRLAALVMAAGAGLASCISFVWLSAPDLAITQLLVETVTTVLLLLALRWVAAAHSGYIAWRPQAVAFSPATAPTSRSRSRRGWMPLSLMR